MSKYEIAVGAGGEFLEVGSRIMRDFLKMEPQRDVEYALYVNRETKTVRWCMAFDTFIGRSCRGSIVNLSFTHMPVDYLRAIFHHAFVSRRCEIMLITVYGSNERSIKFSKKIGFVEAFRLPEGAPDGSDYIIMTHKKADCRFIDKDE